MKRRLVLALLLGSVILLPSVAGAAPPSWYRTESATENQLTTKQRLPCVVIRPRSQCNLAAALKEKQTYLARLESCKTSNVGLPDRAYQCTLSTIKNVGRDPDENIDHVRNGFPIRDANCVGAGAPDASGFKFIRFRCKITVVDHLPAKVTKLHSGRLGITQVAPHQARWEIIS